MNFFQRLIAGMGTKWSEPYAMVGNVVQGRAVFTPRNYASLADEGYSKNAVAYACVNMIAESISSVPIVLYQRKGSKLKEIEKHPVLDLLRFPNPMMPGSTYWESISGYLLLSGNFYVHGPNASKSKPPKELWPLRPDLVQVVAGKYGMPAGFEVTGGGQKKKFPVDPMGAPSEIMQGKLFNPLDPWYGMSPIEAAAFSIDQHNESGKWNVALLQNSARPSGAFIFKSMFAPEKREKIKKDIDDRYAGPNNAGKPLLLEGDFDYKGFSFSPKDMEWIEAKQTSAKDICMAFRVPPQLLGISGDITFANYREARQALWIERVIPYANKILAYHSAWLLPMYGLKDAFFGFDKDQLDALSPSRDALWDRILKATHISPNEKRAATGYEERPEPEYDEVYINSSQVPLVMDDVTDGEQVNPDDLAEENNAAKPENEPDEDEGKGFELKAFNPRNQTERKRLWTSANRRRKSHEKRFANQLKSVFMVEASRVAHAVEGKTGDAAMSAAKVAIDQSREEFLRILKFNMLGIGKEFGEAVFDSIKDGGLNYETKQSDLKFESYLKHWVELHAGQRIANISATTRKKVAKEINKTFANEEGIPELSARIEGLYKDFAGSRATLIARTEMVSASNAASLGAAQATGIDGLKKQWISSNDDRSRDGDGETTNHREEDGVEVPIDQKFEVWSADGIDLMEAPGDQTAPVDQIANCRCSLGFSKGN